MLSQINRYNQGFGSFGPLEQCKEGRLMKTEDVTAEFLKLGRKHKEELRRQVINWRVDVQQTEEKYEQWLQEANKQRSQYYHKWQQAEKKLVISRVRARISATAFVAAVVLFTIHTIWNF